MNKKPRVLAFLSGLKRRGQATIEYVLMLATVVVVLAAALTTFHTDIARWFFTFIGVMYSSK